MIVLIVAMDDARIIGHQGHLPWHIPADLKHFRNKTTNHTVVMGRTTFESIGKPLPNRYNIVVTSHPETMPSASNLQVVASLEAVIREWKHKPEPLYVIGGLSVYQQALPYADALIVSHIPGVHEGDKHFPLFEQDFVVAHEESRSEFHLVEYRRRSPHD